MTTPRVAYEFATPLDDLRAAVLAEGGVLATSLRRFDASARAGVIGAAACEEVWRWVAHLRIVRGLIGPTTVARYADVAARFLAWVVGKRWDYTALVAAQFDAWQQHLAIGLRNKASSRAQKLRALRSFYDWRSRSGLGENCAIAARGPRVEKRKRKKYTTADLQAMFATAAGDAPMAVRDRAMLLFLLTTGARREECARIELESLELRKQRGMVRINGKGAKERDVAIEGPVVAALREWITAREQLPRAAESSCLWLGLSRPRRGRPISTQAVERIVARAARLAGLKTWGVHRFRVTFATQLYDDGVDIERVRVLLGHESIETTRIYLDVSERTRSIRLHPNRQHAALGSRDGATPLWLKRKMEGRGLDAPG